MNIDKFKEAHIAIKSNVADLQKLAQGDVAKNAVGIANTIVSMSSMIKLHLAVEDQMMYPALIKSTNPTFANAGKKFQSEMGAIQAAFMDFSRKWNTSNAVSADPEGFRKDSSNIVKALVERIRREDNELYPIAEKI